MCHRSISTDSTRDGVRTQDPVGVTAPTCVVVIVAVVAVLLSQTSLPFLADRRCHRRPVGTTIFSRFRVRKFILFFAKVFL